MSAELRCEGSLEMLVTRLELDEEEASSQKLQRPREKGLHPRPHLFWEPDGDFCIMLPAATLHTQPETQPTWQEDREILCISEKRYTDHSALDCRS